MLSSRARIAHQRHRLAGAVVGGGPLPRGGASSAVHCVAPHSATLPCSSVVVTSRCAYAAPATAGQEEDSLDSIKHLIKGPMTPLTIFATSPPPAPHPSTYMVPAAVPQAAALDFRLNFNFAQVQQIKQERFKEEMGVFKIVYERPFLREYRSILLEKQAKRKEESVAARKALKEKKRQGLLPKIKKKTAFQLEQERQRKMWMQTLQFPYKVPEIGVKSEELKRYFDFIGASSNKEIYDRLYPEFFGDVRERVESLIPHKHHPYVWTTFFDPENPNDYPDQAEAEEDYWESLNLTPEQQIADLIDQVDGEQERETRMANWEMDPARFKGKWAPRMWPKEELELSHIKQRARNLRYLRDQLKKHGLLEDDSSEDQLLKLEEEQSTEQETTSSDDDQIILKFDSLSKGDSANTSGTSTTSTASDSVAPTSAKDDIASLLNAVVPEEQSVQVAPQSDAKQSAAPDATASEQNQALLREKLAHLKEVVDKRVSEGEDEERVTIEEFSKLAKEHPELGITLDEPENDEKLADIDYVSESNKSTILAVNSKEAMELARQREARLHRLQEHVPVPFDKSVKEKIFANEPISGQPAIEFIHSYSMDPDVIMGSLGRRDFLQRKVVLKVHVPSLGLTPAVRQRLTALVGSRYDAETGVLKLVGDKHPNRHLNQKYLKLLMKELLNEAFLADSRYSPFSDLDVTDPSSLRRKYTLPPQLQELFDGKAGGEWEYKMFSFSGINGRYPTPQDSAREAARLRERLAAALS